MLQLILSLADSSYSGWIRLDWMAPSHSWLEFEQLDTSYNWLHPTSDSNSCSWTRLKANFYLRLTMSCSWLGFWQLHTSYSWFHPVVDSILWLTRVPPAELELRLTYNLICQVNLSTYFANWIIFMVCFQAHDFSYQWFMLWLLLQEPWRGLKKFEEAWRNFKTKAIIIIVIIIIIIIIT